MSTRTHEFGRKHQNFAGGDNNEDDDEEGYTGGQAAYGDLGETDGAFGGHFDDDSDDEDYDDEDDEKESEDEEAEKGDSGS